MAIAIVPRPPASPHVYLQWNAAAPPTTRHSTDLALAVSGRIPWHSPARSRRPWSRPHKAGRQSPLAHSRARLQSRLQAQSPRSQPILSLSLQLSTPTPTQQPLRAEQHTQPSLYTSGLPQRRSTARPKKAPPESVVAVGTTLPQRERLREVTPSARQRRPPSPPLPPPPAQDAPSCAPAGHSSLPPHRTHDHYAL